MSIALALGEKESYESKLSDQLSGKNPIQARLTALLLSDPESAPPIQAHLDMIAKRAAYTEEQFVEDCHAFFAVNATPADIFREFVVQRRGIKKARVRL